MKDYEKYCRIRIILEEISMLIHQFRCQRKQKWHNILENFIEIILSSERTSGNCNPQIKKSQINSFLCLKNNKH
jgi:hypothetical protein